MTTQARLPILQGTLDLLILQTLAAGKQHGQGIARAIQDTSREVVLVEHSSLYPALERLEKRGWISAQWGTSATNRRARFYELTRSGRKQLARETADWWSFVDAVALILGPRIKAGT